MTGLEALLGPALAKAIGSGAARASGWGARELFEDRKKRKIRALLGRTAALIDTTITPEESSLLIEFCSSPEMEHLAGSLTRAYLLEGSGKRADQLAADVENEFLYALAAWLRQEPNPQLARLLYAALKESVLVIASGLNSVPNLSPALKAELIKTASSLSAASVRNATLLAGLREINSLHTFQGEYAGQVRALHATMRLPHAGTTRQIPFEQLFVQPSVWPSTKDRVNEIPVAIEKILAHVTRIVILGDPGGGKSTLFSKLTHDIASGAVPSLAKRVPFLVILRDYASVVRGTNRQTLAAYVSSLCKSPYNVTPPDEAVEYMLLNDRAVVILDGLDELLDTSLRRDVVQAVEGFAHRYPSCPLIVSSRRVGYDEAPLDHELFLRLELSEFSQSQVVEYVNKWFALDESVALIRREELAEAFARDSTFVADLRTNPLLLSLMCGIYASENYIPRNRPDVYEKCALLLFDRWDKQRGIVAPLSFDAHVQGALRSLALYMFTNHATTEGISRIRLISYMKDYLRERRFDDDESAENAATEFIDFCKGRAWVLTDVGAETYGFTHRTFLEYFAASQLVRLTPNAERLLDRLLARLRDGSWDVVAQLALQILNRTAEDGADNFLRLVINESKKTDRLDVNLFSFACRALQFVVPRPAVIKDIVATAVNALLSGRNVQNPGRPEWILSELMMTSSDENRPRIAELIRADIKRALESEPKTEAASLLAIKLPFDAPIYRSGRPYDYWVVWAQENMEIFSEALELQRELYFWVGVVEYEARKISMASLLRSFGVRALYDYKILGSADRPPLAYRYLMAGKRHLSYAGLIREIAVIKVCGVTADLLQQLPVQKAPWIRYRSNYDRLTDVLERGTPRKFSGVAKDCDVVAVLLALPLIEIMLNLNGESWIQQTTGWVSDFAAARCGQLAPENALLQVQEAAAKHPNVMELVDRWLRRELMLVSHLPQKQRQGHKSAEDTARPTVEGA
jgi:hypothetical protein